MPSPRRPRPERTRRGTALRRLAALAFLVAFAVATAAILRENGPIAMPFRDEAARVPCGQVEVRPNDPIWTENELLHGDDLARVRAAAEPLDDRASLAKALVRCRTLIDRPATWIEDRLGEPSSATTDDPTGLTWTYEATNDGFEAECTLALVLSDARRVRSDTLHGCD